MLWSGINEPFFGGDELMSITVVVAPTVVMVATEAAEQVATVTVSAAEAAKELVTVAVMGPAKETFTVVV